MVGGVVEGHFSLRIYEVPTIISPTRAPLDRDTALVWSQLRLVCSLSIARLVRAVPHLVVPPLPVEIPPPVSAASFPEAYTAPLNLEGAEHKNTTANTNIHHNHEMGEGFVSSQMFGRKWL